MSDLPTTEAPDPITKGNYMSPTYHSPSETDSPSQADSNPEPDTVPNTHLRNLRTQAVIVAFIIGCFLLGIVAVIWAYTTGGQPLPF